MLRCSSVILYLLSPICNSNSVSRPLRHVATATSLTKQEPAGTIKKPRWNCNPGLAGVSPTALVPEWRNWQTR